MTTYTFTTVGDPLGIRIGGDCFFHQSAVAGDAKVHKGVRVSFTLGTSLRRPDKVCALSVEVL